MRSSLFSVFSLLGALLLTSCASPAPDHEHEVDWKNGAKRGWIVKIYSPDSPPVDSPECLSMLSATDLAARRFVRIRYRHVRQMFSTLAVLPADAQQPRLDEPVEFWQENCYEGKISRISRIFP